MKSAVFFVLLSILFASVKGDTQEGTTSIKTIVVPNRFIIEVDDLSALHVRRGLDHVSLHLSLLCDMFVNHFTSSPSMQCTMS